MSVFCTGDKIPSIERRGAKIWIEDHPAAFYAILPAEDPVGLAEGFKKIIFNQRNEGFEAYLNSHKWSGQYISLYKIASITAGSVYPKLPSLFDKKSLVDGERIGIDDYFGGIQSMLNYSRLYPNITVLPDDEIVKLRELARKIEGINMAIEK